MCVPVSQMFQLYFLLYENKLLGLPPCSPETSDEQFSQFIYRLSINQ